MVSDEDAYAEVVEMPADDGEFVPVAGQFSASGHGDSAGVAPRSEVLQSRERLIREYHEGHGNLLERLREEGKDDIRSIIMVLIQEQLKETDSLLGNELLSLRDGEYRDASIISYKRTEVIEKAVKALAARLEMEKEGGIDLEHPDMMLVWRYFMEKCKDVLVNKMGVDDEMRDTFFRMLGDEMDNWRSELRDVVEAANGNSR